MEGGGEGVRVLCRVRPLNSMEEKAGSKFVPKFPSEGSISVGVSQRKQSGSDPCPESGFH